MTSSDIQFLSEMGIEPCSLDDPFPRSLPKQEPEPSFVPPKSLREYLTRYPNGIREATEEAAKSLDLNLSSSDLNASAKEVITMFLSFCPDLEDVVEMYVTFRPIRPREDRSEHFHNYIKMRVKAALPVVLGNMGAEER